MRPMLAIHLGAAAPPHRLLDVVAGALLLALLSTPAAAQPAAPEAEAPTVESPAKDAALAPPAGPEDALERGVPRGAVVGYLEAAAAGNWETAAQYLDLRSVPREQRETRGPVLARQLKVVLDRKLWIEPDALSDEPEGRTDDGLPPDRDRVGSIETRRGAVSIFVERVPRAEDGVRIWKFSAATVARVPSLYSQFGYGVLGRLLPAPFFEWSMLEIQLWQWIGLFALVIVAWALSWYLARLLLRVLHPLVARTVTDFDDRLLDEIGSPVRLWLAVLLVSAGTPFLALAIPADRVVTGLEKALLVVALAWLAFRVVDVFSAWVSDRLVAQGQGAATAVLPLGRRVVKVILGALAFVAMLQNFGFNVTTLLAGLGVGGLAVALGAQKTLENVFGGITVIADRPVRVGDFCRWGDKVGTVEDVGLRSTRVRTLDRTLVSIPNANFAQMELENFAVRDRMRIHATLGLRYETTPDQLRWVLVEIRKLLYAHPKVTPEPARVRLVGFGAYSLDLEIFAYVDTRDFNEFLAVREDVYLRIMDVVDESGSGFAFPSQTTYLEKGEGMDAEKTRAAEERVQTWREKQELYLPSFPQEAIARLDDSLDYPPRGSASPPRS